MKIKINLMKVLKSNMDRFIVVAPRIAKYHQKPLKSNMDRFIVFSPHLSQKV